MIDANVARMLQLSESDGMADLGDVSHGLEDERQGRRTDPRRHHGAGRADAPVPHGPHERPDERDDEHEYPATDVGATLRVEPCVEGVEDENRQESDDEGAHEGVDDDSHGPMRSPDPTSLGE